MKEQNPDKEKQPERREPEEAAKQQEQEEEQLLITLMKKKAELEKLEQRNQQIRKEQKQIEASRTWKYSKPLRKLSAVSGKVRQILQPGQFKLPERVAQLEAENQKLKEKLKKSRDRRKTDQEQLRLLKLELEKLDSGELETAARQAKADGEILEYLDGLIEKKSVHDDRYNTALRFAAKLFTQDREALKHLVYRKALTGFKIEDIPEFIVREGETAEAVPLRQAASFRASLTVRMRKRQLGASLPEWLLDNKTTAYAFADQLNIRRPWTSRAAFPAKALPFQTGMVVKPLDGSGSRGVYLVQDTEQIRDVKRSETIAGREALRGRMEQDLASGWVEQDEWMMEELLLENSQTGHPARDLKFYCFYGKVALILEIHRFPELKYCWWTGDGRRIHTGKYENELFKGEGASRQECGQAASISRELPTPFVRIDFLKTGNELVFGEFTPKPGNYDAFDTPTDQWLGDCFLEAENRLNADLAAGRFFPDFTKILEETKTSQKQE